jgi:hypothetical protein
MARCKCLKTEKPHFYPARLISLKQLKAQRILYTKTLESVETYTEVDVHLEETCEWYDGPPKEDDGRKANNVWYVTLSHCWGIVKDESKRTKLTSENIGKLKNGMKLNKLPKTFREAMQFAARLPEVGYIWIDSLCIKQGDEADWLEQSASMDRVYNNAFLNLSATAAENSEQGLFSERAPEILVEDEVMLNIAGLPGFLSPSQSFSSHSQEAGGAMLQTDLSDMGATKDAKGKALRRCTVLDLSFWEKRVDEAPVNKRGWVLQERLMAPRVLHFCQGQVAWECCGFEAAEGQPEGIPNYQLTPDGIRAGSRLKGLNASTDGVWLRKMRLRGSKDPDPHLQPGIYALELWRRIVEVYSRTAVTQPGDKLIALSGMARWMSKEIEESPKAAVVQTTGSAETSDHGLPKTTQYVAGLWALHLASQLLWYVEPTFRHADSTFEHLTSAPEPTMYRAPSFSWAAIDAEKGNGIKYGEVTDQDLLIMVEEISVTPRSGSDEFGMLDRGAYIELQAKLRKAVLFKKPPDRFGWRLIDRVNIDKEEHTDVYLDCPTRDGTGNDNEGILGHNAGIFVVPAAFTDRRTPRESKYLTCLIIQLDKKHEAGPVFKRVGLTKLSPYGDHKALYDREILKPYDSDIGMLPEGVPYDPATGMHRIRLI